MQAPRAYVLEWTGDRVTVMHARRAGQGVRSELLLDAADPAGEEAAALLQRVHAEALEGAAIPVAALPASLLLVRRLTAPFPSARKARQVFPSLLDIRLPFPVESCVFGLEDEGPADDGGFTCVAAAVRRDQLAEQLAAWRKPGIDPALVDALPLALWDQALRASPPASDDEPGAVIWAGPDRLEVMIGRGRRLFQVSGAPSPGATDAEASRITARLLPFLRSVFPDPGSITWRLCGPGAASENMAGVLARALSLDPGKARRLDAPERFHLLALAERALLPGRSACQLRPDDLEHEAVRRARLRTRRAGILRVAAAAAVVLLLQAGWLFVSASRENALAADLRVRAAALSGGVTPPPGQERLLAERGLETLRASLAPFADIRQPGQTALLDRLLRAANTAGLRIESLVLRPGMMTLQGTSPDWYGPETLLEAVREAGVQLPLTLDRKDAGSDERVHFTVRTSS